uniref:PrgH/EprH family type III secretion apparatus protein n=1 Tax=Yersinia frederiksenii TaxID=29484 RepID=UPI001F4C2527|nr:PrgH/EprH family type III secretion apparatus protein [Yersinia frederiksenii]ULG19984.1 type III secretion system protein PrgH [Yersinia frederiksenii]
MTISVVSKPKVLRVLNGLLNGCEFIIDSERLLVVVGTDSVSASLESFVELPSDTIFIPQNENGINFEITLNQDDENQISLRELGGDEPTIRNISFNSRVQVGDVIFALREKDDKWESDILGLSIENPINGSKWTLSGRKKNVFIYVIVVFFFLIVSGTGYWFYNTVDSNMKRLNKTLANSNNELRLIQGNDRIVYVFTEDQRKAIWVNQVIERGDYTNAVRVIYPEKETEHIYSWLNDHLPNLKYFRLQLDNVLIPRLMVSKQRSHLTDNQMAEMRTQLMSVMPYAKDVEILEINDNDLINQAEEELGSLGLDYKQKKTNDYISYSVGGELGDGELIRLQSFVDNFYHQWGREFIRFNISLENDNLKDKSFSYGDYDYVKLGPGQWLFKNEERRSDL